MKTYLVACNGKMFRIGASSPKVAAKRILAIKDVRPMHSGGALIFNIRVEEAQ